MSKIKSEIRQHYFLKQSVIITPGRKNRPRDIQEEEITKKQDGCPFCRENLRGNEIVDRLDGHGKQKWQVAAIKNFFPALSLDNPRAYGKQEVIVETPFHERDLGRLPAEQIELVLKMFARRTAALQKIKKIDYVLCFKNQGPKSGATLSHTHSQILAAALVPENLKEEAGAVLNYRAENKTCPYCDIIKKEMKSPRKIWADKNMACFAPYASAYHYEAWIFPKRHLDNITALQEKEIKSLAKILKIVLVGLGQLGLSYNFFLHNVVSDPNQHFYLKIEPRDSIWGGVELGSGLIINSVRPEDAAKFYRQVAVKKSLRRI